MKRIGFIGCGNMASAMIGGLIRTGYDAAYINVFDIDAAKANAFGERGAAVCADEIDVAKKSDFIVLAVKPQVMKPLLEKLGRANESAVYVSIAAGVSTASVKRFLGYDAKVVRVMPNTSLLIGLGATAVSHSAPVNGEEFEFVKGLFTSGGIVEEVGEDMMNAVISVNGSSPAYVYYLAKAVVDGAEKQGIDRETALRLFAKVLEGGAKMLTDSGFTPEELIDRVCSKGGTTIEAINVFDARGVEDAVVEGMEACTKRACELDLK
ncbi:MAG: pyrroline-5-carboxylate reductase [Clostridia bacterium]|nr:pyrroline-5-carboxylate reductase [Clostridia bacterium]